MHKAIIFDLDGVLINSEPVNIRAGEQAFREFNYSLSNDDLTYIPGRHSADYVPIIIKNNNLALEAEPIAARSHELFHTLWQEMVVLMPGAKDTLTTLKQKGYILALVTSSDRQGVKKFLKKFKFEDVFTVTVSADDVQHRKPHPEPYLKAMELLNQTSDNLTVIEDTAVGITAAKAAGLRCIAVPNSYTKNQDFSQADYIVSSLKQLLILV